MAASAISLPIALAARASPANGTIPMRHAIPDVDALSYEIPFRTNSSFALRISAGAIPDKLAMKSCSRSGVRQVSDECMGIRIDAPWPLAVPGQRLPERISQRLEMSSIRCGSRLGGGGCGEEVRDGGGAGIALELAILELEILTSGHHRREPFQPFAGLGGILDLFRRG